MSSAPPSRFGQEKGFVHARAASHAESNHVQKRKRRNKDLEIVFDANSHRDYVQGFRKRKQQRRKEAVKALEKLSKEQKIEERAERRQAKREQYEKFLPPDVRDSEDENGGCDGCDGGDDAGDEREFEDGSKRQTVKVTAIRTEQDDEFEEQLVRRKKAMAASEMEDDGKGGIRKKMTKKGMSVLNNTKMKLMGKHRFDGAKRKKKVEDGGSGGGGGKGSSGPMKRKGVKRKGRK